MLYVISGSSDDLVNIWCEDEQRGWELNTNISDDPRSYVMIYFANWINVRVQYDGIWRVNIENVAPHVLVKIDKVFTAIDANSDDYSDILTVQGERVKLKPVN